MYIYIFIIQSQWYHHTQKINMSHKYVVDGLLIFVKKYVLDAFGGLFLSQKCPPLMLILATHSEKCSSDSFPVWRNVTVMTVFLLLMVQTEVRLVFIQKENCHYGRILLNLKGVRRRFLLKVDACSTRMIWYSSSRFPEIFICIFKNFVLQSAAKSVHLLRGEFLYDYYVYHYIYIIVCVHM